MMVWVRDMVERAASTFLEAFVASVAAGAFVFDVPTAKAAAVAGLAAALSVVKSVLAVRVTGTVSPASVVAGKR